MKDHRADVESIAFHPTGDLLATGSEDKTVKVWSVADRQLVRTLEGHKDEVTSVTFSPDGKLIDVFYSTTSPMSKKITRNFSRNGSN